MSFIPVFLYLFHPFLPVIFYHPRATPTLCRYTSLLLFCSSSLSLNVSLHPPSTLSFLRFSGSALSHLHSLSYLVSSRLFSRLPGDELFSRAWIGPEAFLLLQQCDTDNSPVLTSHFKVEWSSIMEAFEKGLGWGNTLPKQNNNERLGFVFVYLVPTNVFKEKEKRIDSITWPEWISINWLLHAFHVHDLAL